MLTPCGNVVFTYTCVINLTSDTYCAPGIRHMRGKPSEMGLDSEGLSQGILTGVLRWPNQNIVLTSWDFKVLPRIKLASGLRMVQLGV